VTQPSLHLIIPGEPVALPRQIFRLVVPNVLLDALEALPPDATRREVRATIEKHALILPRPFDKASGYAKWLPGAQRSIEEQTQHHVKFTGPLWVGFLMVHRCRQGDMRVRTPAPVIWHSFRPDFDNVIKGLLDPGNDLLFEDDAQICAGTFVEINGKQFDRDHIEQPRCEVLIRSLEGVEPRAPTWATNPEPMKV